MLETARKNLSIMADTARGLLCTVPGCILMNQYKVFFSGRVSQLVTAVSIITGAQLRDKRLCSMITYELRVKTRFDTSPSALASPEVTAAVPAKRPDLVPANHGEPRLQGGSTRTPAHPCCLFMISWSSLRADSWPRTFR